MYNFQFAIYFSSTSMLPISMDIFIDSQCENNVPCSKISNQKKYKGEDLDKMMPLTSYNAIQLRCFAQFMNETPTDMNQSSRNSKLVWTWNLLTIGINVLLLELFRIFFINTHFSLRYKFPCVPALEKNDIKNTDRLNFNAIFKLISKIEGTKLPWVEIRVSIIVFKYRNSFSFKSMKNFWQFNFAV